MIRPAHARGGWLMSHSARRLLAPFGYILSVRLPPSITLTRSGSRYQGSRSLTRPAGVAQRRARGWATLPRVLVKSACVS